MSGGVLRQVGRFETAPAGRGNAGTAVARTEAPPARVDMDTACGGFAQCSDPGGRLDADRVSAVRLVERIG
jgi:hypothetical protein